MESGLAPAVILDRSGAGKDKRVDGAGEGGEDRRAMKITRMGGLFVTFALALARGPAHTPVAATGFAHAQASSPRDPFRLELVAPIATWDEAIPLGNGLTGGLLWGQDRTLRLSLDRADLWDLRTPDLYLADDPELRERSIRQITALGFDGYALGGLSVGEERGLTWEAVGQAAPLLPAEQPRYFMGIGDPQGILEVIERGVDMFDCVLPTRLGRTGTALTSTGRLNLRNAAYARDPRPLDEKCSCNSCQRFLRAYVRHLVNQEEVLGLRLLTFHNLHFLLRLTEGARTAIERGELASFKAETLGRLTASSEEAA
jgi:hypothetical protein